MYILRKMFNDLMSHKDLIMHLTISDFKANVARTYLGFLWWIVDPILYMAIFYFLVQVILQRGGPDYSVFLFVALIPLKWTISCLVDSVNAISSKGRIIQQIYVPKIVFVFIRFLVNSTKFLVSCVVLLLFIWVYGVELSANLFYFPIVVFIHGLFLFSCMLILAHIGVYLLDIKNMMQYLARTLMYLSPVMYSIDAIPDELVKWLYINPLTSILSSYRNILLYSSSIQFFILLLIPVSIVLLYIGLKLLFKYDKEYAKVV